MAPSGTTDTISVPPSPGVSWTTSPSGYCTQVGSITSTYFDLRCSRALTYLITVYTTGTTQTINLPVSNCQDLYGWYAAAVVPPAAGGAASSADLLDTVWTHDNLTIRLWIQSRALASDPPLRSTGITTFPSNSNAAVTKKFQRMGLSPRLQTNFRDQYDVFFYCDPAVTPAFDTANGFYTFTCPRNAFDRYGYYDYGLTDGT